MGFREPEGDTFLLKFTESAYEGAEVRCRRRVAMGVVMEMERLADEQKGISVLLGMFAEQALIDWNVETAIGEPLPANVDGLKTISVEFAMLIIKTWLEAVATISAPLASPSPNGSTSAVGSGLTEA